MFWKGYQTMLVLALRTGLRDDLTSHPTLPLVFRQPKATTRTTRSEGFRLTETTGVSSQALSSDPSAHPPAPCGRLSRRGVMPTNLAASRPCRLYSSIKKRNAQAGTPRTVSPPLSAAWQGISLVGRRTHGAFLALSVGNGTRCGRCGGHAGW